MGFIIDMSGKKLLEIRRISSCEGQLFRAQLFGVCKFCPDPIFRPHFLA
jgi:hypothetical protein